MVYQLSLMENEKENVSSFMCCCTFPRKAYSLLLTCLVAVISFFSKYLLIFFLLFLSIDQLSDCIFTPTTHIWTLISEKPVY